jgi:hypothetical protein
MKRLAALAVLLLVFAATPVAAQELESDEQQLVDALVGERPEESLEEEPEIELVPAEPLGPDAMTGDLKAAGHKNGRLPDSALVEVGAGTNERCYLEAEAAATWELLVLAAEYDGVTGFAAGWCYRSLPQQKRTFERNCPWVTPPAPAAVEGEEPPPAPAPSRVCKLPTAKPGTSNHGWGRAIDVVDTTTRKAHILNCSDPQFAWLLENGERFGWVLPRWARCGARSQEPWHFEWAGISVPISQVIIVEREARGAEIPH